MKMEFINNGRFKVALIGLSVVALAIALVNWAGIPTDNMAAFSIGVASLVGALFLFAYLFWYLLRKPLPAGYKQPVLHSVLSPAARQLLAILLAISGLCLVIGGFWDEVWHRVYDFPFGPDLFWRPHLLMYFAFLTSPILGGLALIYLLRRGKGSWQQRFRADPLVGFFVLLGGFIVYSTAADPIWHVIYGDDISAWSLPHLMLLLSVNLIAFLSMALQLSLVPARPWGWLARPAFATFLVIFAQTTTLILGLQVLATDWENNSAIVQQRPDWLLALIFTLLATFTAVAVSHATRRVGAGTAVGLLALLIRYALIQLFDYQAITVASWLAVFPPMVAIDIWYGFNQYRGRGHDNTPGTALAAAMGLAALSLWLMNRTIDYPELTGVNIITSIVFSFIAALGAGWAGRTLGDYLAGEHKLPLGQATRQTKIVVRYLSPAAFAAVILFIVLFIVTATPPT